MVNNHDQNWLKKICARQSLKIKVIKKFKNKFCTDLKWTNYFVKKKLVSQEKHDLELLNFFERLKIIFFWVEKIKNIECVI